MTSNFLKNLQNELFTFQEYTIVTIYSGRQVFAFLRKTAGCKLTEGMGRKITFLTQESLACKNVFPACEGKIHPLPGVNYFYLSCCMCCEYLYDL